MPLQSLLLLCGVYEFAAFINAVTVAVPSATTSCYAIIRSVLPDKVFSLQDPEYIASRATYWSKQEQLISPSCIVTPATANDIATAIDVLSAAGSCPFAVKSSGHLAHAGASNVQDGLTIDLSRLTRFSLKDDKSSTTIGSGLR
ncbi:MAG: hypothetical protein L6R41_003362 [Letrouitia leprolyta]|nr:MAG: hypothetical protein L6R41_003362 [Letrouitia leprolyta]